MKRKKNLSPLIPFGILCFALLTAVASSMAFAETLYVDSRKGDDANPGSKEQPLKTLLQAANLVNQTSEAGPTVIKLAPGVHNLTERVLFENRRAYTKEKRLIIEATILPDDPEWKPGLMPVILSTQERGEPDASRPTGTSMYGLQIEVSHATIRGLKFLGNPAPHNRYYPIRRNGKNLEDLVVTQCLFVGDRHALPIHLAIIANGHGLVVDHCVFYGCKNAIVFWDAEEGTSKGNAMTYCIVDGGYKTGVWVTGTDADFEFNHNIITRCEYFFVRGGENQTRYRIRDSIVANNQYYSGYGTAAGPTGQTGAEITFDESNLIKKGNIVLMADHPRPAELSLETPRNYLHIEAGTLGSDLGAGLFKRKNASAN